MSLYDTVHALFLFYVLFNLLLKIQYCITYLFVKNWFYQTAMESKTNALSTVNLDKIVGRKIESWSWLHYIDHNLKSKLQIHEKEYKSTKNFDQN